MKLYPYKRAGQMLQSDADGVAVTRGFVASIEIPAEAAVVASTTGILAAQAGTAQEITTGFAQPAWPRALTATAGGTATDIKAIQVVVEGTNFNDEPITETLPAFTVDTVGTVQGNKAFKTITKVTIPAHDGAAATTSIGFNEKLGLPFKLTRNTVLAAYRNNAKEGTAPAVTVSATEIAGNTIDLNSALNGTVVNVDVVV